MRVPSPVRFVVGSVVGGFAVLVLLLTGTAHAQPEQPEDLSPQARVSLITGLPGNQLHTEFGHSALRVVDPGQGFDWLYNYGTFDFGDPYFVPKFTYGRLQYFLSISTYRGTVQAYRRQGRPVIEQRLRLRPQQRQRLWDFLRHNAQPAHRTYAYDFLFDNCSTRIRDAFRSALGDEVRFAGAPDPDRTFREMLDLYVGDRPLLDVGFDLALGQPADADVSADEAMFLPEYLLAAFAEATVRVDGRWQPLVTATDTVTWVEGYDARAAVFDWPVALGWILFVLTAGWTGWQAATGRRPGAAGDGLLLGIAGTTGGVAAFLWFVAEHTVTNYNWNLLWAWPTHLLAAGAFLRVGNGLRSVLGAYLGAAATTCGLLALAWAWVPQNLNAAFFPVLLLLSVRFGWQALHLLGGAPHRRPPAGSDAAPEAAVSTS
jgi:hypothetical protein